MRQLETIKAVKPKTALSEDALVGAVIRTIRMRRNITQKELGKSAGGISFQQIQKYEAGTNRISLSRLCQISRALGATPTRLLELAGLNNR